MSLSTISTSNSKNIELTLFKKQNSAQIKHLDAILLIKNVKNPKVLINLTPDYHDSYHILNQTPKNKTRKQKKIEKEPEIKN